MGRLIDEQTANKAVRKVLRKYGFSDDSVVSDEVWDCIENEVPTAYDMDKELRILKNYIDNMPKVYRKRNANWVIVQELLMAGTLHAGRTSSIKKCIELGIDAYDYDLIVKGGGVDEN